MTQRIIIRHIRRLWLTTETSEEPLRGAQMANLPYIDDAYLVLEAGRIKAYGQMRDFQPEKWASAEEHIDAKGGDVLPAFCDSHTHLVFADWRAGEFVDKVRGASYAEIAAKGGGILNSALRLRLMDEEELFERAYGRLKEVMAQGTGAIEIKSGYGLDMASELKMLRVIRRLRDLNLIPVRSTFLAAHAVPPEFKGDQEGYLQHIIRDMLPRVAGEGLADYCDIFCERGFFTVEDTDKLLQAAAKYGLGAKIHANQLDFSGGVQIGVQHKARSVDHLEHAGAEEIAALLGSQTMPTLLPSAAFFLRMPYPPAREMIDAGLPLALATDYNPGSSPSGRMSFVLSLACLYMRILPAEALAAATLNGAWAMDLQREVGSISIGKQAKIILTQPLTDIAMLPYRFGEDFIAKIIV